MKPAPLSGGHRNLGFWLKCIQSDETSSQTLNLQRMINLMLVTIHIQKERLSEDGESGSRRRKKKWGVTLATLAEKYEVKLPTLKSRQHKGQRVLCMASADDAVGRLVEQIVIPKIAQLRASEELTAQLSVQPGVSDMPLLDFSCVSSVDLFLESLATLSFKLPPRDPAKWDVVISGISKPFSVPRPPSKEALVAEVEHLQLGFELQEKKPPTLTRENWVEWTEAERKKVEDSPWAENMEELKEMLDNKDHSYSPFSTQNVKGQGLQLLDSHGGSVALIITNMLAIGPKIKAVNDKIRAIYFAEDVDDNSRCEGFEYIAQHFQIAYNRYCENGTNAPANIHPDWIRAQDASRVNYGQRIHHPSKDVLDKCAEFDLLCGMLSDIREYVAVNLHHHLPDIYQELEAYTSLLPLFQDSAVHPFSGFVLNISSCAAAHRDDLLSQKFRQRQDECAAAHKLAQDLYQQVWRMCVIADHNLRDAQAQYSDVIRLLPNIEGKIHTFHLPGGKTLQAILD
ncbi:hypothetical protein FPV67DRAFT_1673907 [Lyophyllum atratum]|nr:hypothetical protein FPV67DRAFT_1673907 [Lyophyllum atratum]